MSDAPNGWVGFDLDGTLAHYDHWRGEEHIGDPVPAMVKLLKEWRANGYPVRIFTARASTVNFTGGPYEASKAITAISAWCLKHLGEVLPVTCTKDYQMLLLYDDRCRQVEPNTGRIAQL